MSSRYTHGPNSSVSSITSVTSISNMGPGNVNQQRRLAEFATILGDYKLAIPVWEALRKEARGGSVRTSPAHSRLSLKPRVLATGYSPAALRIIASPGITRGSRNSDAHRTTASTDYTVRGTCPRPVPGTDICCTLGNWHRPAGLSEPCS